MSQGGEGQPNPCVAVLIPAYNAEKYVRETIQSVLNQTYQNFVIVIINDGSVDRTRDIILSMSDDRIVLLDNECNLGLVETRNRGLQWIYDRSDRFEYMAFLDADDIAFPCRFMKQIEFLQKKTDFTMCGTCVQYFGNSNKKGFYQQSYKTLQYAYLANLSRFSNPSMMLRVDTMKRNKYMYDTAYSHAEDAKFWADIIATEKGTNLPEILLGYRWHSSNTSVTHFDLQTSQAQNVVREEVESLLGRPISNLEFEFLSLRFKANQYDCYVRFFQEIFSKISKKDPDFIKSLDGRKLLARSVTIALYRNKALMTFSQRVDLVKNLLIHPASINYLIALMLIAFYLPLARFPRLCNNWLGRMYS